MNAWINQSKYVQNLAEDLLTAKKTHYQQDYISKDIIIFAELKVLENKHFSYRNISLCNIYKQKIKATVFISSKQSQQIQRQYCIIYLHGFGSHRLQGTTLLSALSKFNNQFGLCCFDFSGSGKSQGQISAYGIKQYLDIKSVIQMLKQQYKFKKFVLWGRSMGAVASLLYTSLSQTQKQDILFQVLDSPFNSFQSIAKHHGSVSYKFPQLFIDFGLNILKNHFKQHQFNPFQINLCNIVGECQVPALFVYSQDDVIIPPENSINIIEKFNNKILYEKIIIQQNHNNFRSNQTLINIINIIKKYVYKSKIREKIKYKKGILQICSNPNTPNTKTSIIFPNNNNINYNNNNNNNINQTIKITKLSGCNNKCSKSQKKRIILKSNSQDSTKNGDISYCWKYCAKLDENKV